MFYVGRVKRIFVLFVALSLAGCGNSSPPITPVPPGPVQPPATTTEQVQFNITWPDAASQALSPAAKSITITAASAASPSVVAATVTINRPASQATLRAPLGTTIFTARAYDQADGQGKLLGQGATQQQITAGATNTVVLSLNNIVDRVTVSAPTANLAPGDSLQATATAYDAANSTVIGSTFNWTTGDSRVATVSTGGLVTAVGVGTTTVSATDAASGKQGTMTITVTQTGVTVQTLTLGPGTGSIPRGSSVQFTAQALDSAQQPIPDAVYTYSSSNPSVLNVDSRGQGRALGEGTATITVKSGSKITTASLTVTASSTALSAALWKAVEPVRPLQLRDLGQDADGTFWGFGERFNEARLFRSTDGKNWAPVYMNNTSAPACSALYGTSDKVTLAAFSKENLWLTCNDTLYQSVNGGLYWMERLADSSLDGERVKVNPANPNMMVIGGIYSSDAGRTWKKRSYSNDLTISSAYSKTIFAATEKSLDQGVTWQPYGKPFASPGAFSVQGEAITPAGQLMQVVGADVAGVWTTGLYVSSDLGATWTKKSSLSIPKYAKVLFTLYKSQPNVMYVQWPDGLAISQDSGANFKVVSSKYAFPDEGDSSVIYRPLPVSQVGNTYNFIKGLSRSLDGGITWVDIVTPIYPSGNIDLSDNVRVLRDKDGRVLVATGSGLWAAPGAKDTFSSAGNNLGLTIQSSQAGVIDRTQASRLFAITSDEYYGRGKPYLTETTGSQWLKLGTASLQSLTQNGVTATIWHGATSMGDVLTSTDSGLSWSWTGRVPFNQDGQGAASLVLRASRQNTARLYALSPAGVHRSENSGQTWQWASVNLQHASGTDLSVDPLNDQTVYLATNHAGIYKTMNSGQDWKAVNNGLSNLEVRCLAISPDGSSLLAGTNDGGVYRSLDRGGTWEFVSSLLQSYAVTDVEFDPSDANVAYATTTGGVYKTVDKGSSWVIASKGLTSPYITWVQVSSDGKTLYLGTNDQEVFTGSPSSNTGADFRTQSIQRKMN